MGHAVRVAWVPHCRDTNVMITSRLEETLSSVSAASVAVKSWAAKAALNEAITYPLSTRMVPPISKITSRTVRIVFTYYARRIEEIAKCVARSEKSVP